MGVCAWVGGLEENINPEECRFVSSIRQELEWTLTCYCTNCGWDNILQVLFWKVFTVLSEMTTTYFSALAM